MKKKKTDRGFKYFWEEPQKDDQVLFSGPFEVKFSFPHVGSVNEVQQTPPQITETQNDITVAIDVNGFKKDEINVQVSNSTIELNAKKKHQHVSKGEMYVREETMEKVLRKTFNLPVQVNPDSVSAKLEGHVLRIKLRKLETKEKKKKKVSIK